MNLMIFTSFIACIALVGLLTWFQMRKHKFESQDSYYLGGRSLTGLYIGSSLLLTNLSTEQMVGLNGQAFGNGMIVMAWEVTSAVTLVCLAKFFLPRYLKSGITTVADFFKDRFDNQTNILIAVLFVIGYVLTYLPTVLYSGSLVLNQIFDIQQIFGINEFQSLWLMSFSIGILGSIYAIVGGTKAIAISDTWMGILLIIGALLIPIYGLIELGNGSFTYGIDKLITSHPEKLNSIGSLDSIMPWPVLFLGLFFNNLFYWCTNQAIIQRTLGAKNLAEGQKGALLCGAFKCLGALVLALPGVIAYALFGDGLSTPDLAYPMLVKAVLPTALVGFFAAALFGAILSSFDGALNSTATLFSLNIYKPLVKENKSDEEIIKVGKKFGLGLAMLSMIIAPFISYFPSGLYSYLQECFGFYNVPILASVVVGLLTKKVPAKAPKIVLIVHVVLYGLSKLLLPDVNFLYVLSFMFPFDCWLMVMIGKIYPREKDYIQHYTEQVEIKPWKHVNVASTAIIILMFIIYGIFSKVGIAV